MMADGGGWSRVNNPGTGVFVNRGRRLKMSAPASCHSNTCFGSDYAPLSISPSISATSPRRPHHSRLHSPSHLVSPSPSLPPPPPPTSAPPHPHSISLPSARRDEEHQPVAVRTNSRGACARVEEEAAPEPARGGPRDCECACRLIRPRQERKALSTTDISSTAQHSSRAPSSRRSRRRTT